jgi:dienelactone hydrolase
VTTTASGPDGKYTLIAPAALGENGFKHPLITWGNGIATNPTLYPGLLGGIASHGFVIVASDSTAVNAALMTTGLDWLIQQNDPGGLFEGKLNTSCLATVGYSLGGGGAVQAGSHADVLATVAFHNLRADAANLNGPLLLITSTADGFVPKASNAQLTYDSSAKVATVMATWNPGEPPSNTGHLTPLGDAGVERAPAIAWLRHWIYGDVGAKKYFYGADCILCERSGVSPNDACNRRNPRSGSREPVGELAGRRNGSCGAEHTAHERGEGGRDRQCHDEASTGRGAHAVGRDEAADERAEGTGHEVKNRGKDARHGNTRSDDPRGELASER